MPKKKVISNKARLLIIYFLGLILAISVALPAYVQSNFLKQFVSLGAVSLFFVIANAITVIAILFYPRLIKKISNYMTTKLTLVVYFIALISLSFTHTPLIALLGIILFSVTSNLIWINIDVVLESFSSNTRTGRIRTTNLTFANIGWILAPNLSGYLVNLGGYTLTFMISAVVIVLFFIVFLKQGKNLKDKITHPKGSIKKAIITTWSNKNLRGVFFASLLLSVFYSSAVVYIPVYLHEMLGIGWRNLGIMFSIMLLPFVLIEIPAGVLADKYIGEKEMMTTGMIILIASLFLFWYISIPALWLWTLVLFFSRVGAALVESTKEAYFFKIVDVEDIGLINFFRTANPLGYIIGPGLAILILSFFPLPYIFLLLGVIMISGIGFIAMIKDTK